MAARLLVQIAADELEATVSVSAGEPAGVAEVWQALGEADVTSGHDTEAILVLGEELAERDFTAADVVVARGRAQRPGRDGEARLIFREEKSTGAMRADGTLDYRARNTMTPVTVGALVGVYIEPTEGVDGISVRGRVLPASVGRDERPRLGEGLTWGDDGELRARKAGILCRRAGGLLDVSEHVEHNGDVDLNSGDLESGKSLVIRGRVCWGMIVQTEEELRIIGDVEGGVVTAKGEAAITGAVVGTHMSTVAAGGALSVGRAQNATLRSGEQLEVLSTAVSSELCGREVIVAGRMAGGSANGESLVRIKEAGGPAQTVLRCAVPVCEFEKGLRELVESARWQRAHRAQRGHQRRAGPRGNKRRGRMARTSKIPGDTLAAHALESRQRIEELAQRALVEVGEAHRGLEVIIAGRRRVLDEELKDIRLRLSTATDSVLVEKVK